MQKLSLFSKDGAIVQSYANHVARIIDQHFVQNVTVLTILEPLEFKSFSYRPTMVADNTFQCSMACAL